MVLRSTFDFAVSRSWLLLPSTAAGAGAGYAIDGLAPVMAGGAALGLAPAMAAGLALELRGHRLRTPDDVERRVHLETLATVGRFKQQPDSALPAGEYPEALRAYRELAASLRGRGGRELRTLLVTSAGPEEGKSTTAANLATVLAEQGNKVVLVDGDLRWSSLRSTNAHASSLGLSGLLLNYLHTPQLAIVRTNEHNLFLLPSGSLPPNPQELLALPRLGDIIASLRGMADYVIFDSPPVLEAADARLLACNMDATLLVMHAGKSRSREVNRALRILTQVEVRPLGAVLNAVRAPKPATAPVAPPVPTSEPATYAAPASPATPALHPYTIEAFRKGPPRPISANVPRPGSPVPKPAVVRLAQEGLESKGTLAGSVIGAAAKSDSSDETAAPSPVGAGVAGADVTARRFRVVEPNERPLTPTTSARVPVLRDPVPLASVPAEPEVAPSREVVEPPTSALPGLVPDASVDEVLAHMRETLRLIRELREEKSGTNS